jgi:hypothetical protein
MMKTVAWGALALVLLSTTAMARDGSGVSYGRDEGVARRRPAPRTGAWIADHHRPGGHLNGHHGHFSPRGQGGYHWGW